MSISNERMGDEMVESDEEISKMFLGKRGAISSDEELALHIMHRFNIDRDTMETMPAFEEHLKPLFSREKDE
jgi:hypothetical protein